MARKRRISAASAVARQRLAGLNKITPAPNLGPNISVAAYQGVFDDTAALEESHNQLAAQMDDSSNRFDAQENLMADWNRRVLSAVEAQYGPDSSEYEMCVGTRKSERKRPKRKSGSGGTTPPGS
ncbi:MAG: hypothetical protein QOH70_1718 [Blastocatellia bacterium]|jgi:hypothetical protein|nr:hypothetical protein [Blastocatellia bacterium]